jgi:predicted ATPase
LDDSERARTVLDFSGLDSRGLILTWLPRTLAVLGFADQARLGTDEFLARGRALRHTPTLAHSCNGAAHTSWLIGDQAKLSVAAETLHKTAVDNSFPFWLIQSKIFLGWVEIEAGNTEQGCYLISEGIAAFDALDSIQNQHFNFLLLAGGQLRSGKIDDGLISLARAESHIMKTGAAWCEAEVHRLRGDLQLARSAKVDAEASYQKALDISRSQDAKLWEIRAATSLSRLWYDQGKGHEARDLLAPVYNWFTEGFDTPDVVDAKALLEELQ